jgi:hypothetical protein
MLRRAVQVRAFKFLVLKTVKDTEIGVHQPHK